MPTILAPARVAGSTATVTSTSKITGGGGPKINLSQGPLVITEQGAAVRVARPTSHAIVAMINVVARVIVLSLITLLLLCEEEKSDNLDL
jgi:hypothetical protein